jgi:hypothetical protein
MKHLRSVFFCVPGLLAGAASFCGALPLHAQAIYTAGKLSDIEVGGGFLDENSDYGKQPVSGIAVWGIYNINRTIGLQAEGNFGTIRTPADIQESNFGIGPRVSAHWHHTSLYGLFVVGLGMVTNNPQDVPSFRPESARNPYGIFGFGAGVEYRVSRKIVVRPIQIEVQKWTAFTPHTLSPMLYTFGVSYVVR